MDWRDYVESRAKLNQINNDAVGKVVGLDNAGRHTVELDGGRRIMVFSATGSPYNIGDTVTVRFMGKDRRQAEIAGKSTRRLAVTKISVWR